MKDVLWPGVFPDVEEAVPALCKDALSTSTCLHQQHGLTPVPVEVCLDAPGGQVPQVNVAIVTPRHKSAGGWLCEVQSCHCTAGPAQDIGWAGGRPGHTACHTKVRSGVKALPVTS